MKKTLILVIALLGAHICQAHIPACTTHTSISMVTPEEDESEENDEEEDEKGTKIPLRVNKELTMTANWWIMTKLDGVNYAKRPIVLKERIVQ